MSTYNIYLTGHGRLDRGAVDFKVPGNCTVRFYTDLGKTVGAHFVRDFLSTGKAGEGGIVKSCGPAHQCPNLTLTGQPFKDAVERNYDYLAFINGRNRNVLGENPVLAQPKAAKEGKRKRRGFLEEVITITRLKFGGQNQYFFHWLACMAVQRMPATREEVANPDPDDPFGDIQLLHLG